MSYIYNFITNFIFVYFFIFGFKKLATYKSYNFVLELKLMICISFLDLILFKINTEPMGWGIYYIALTAGMYKVYFKDNYYFFKIYIVTFFIFQIADILVGYILHKFTSMPMHLSDTFIGFVLYKDADVFSNYSLYNEFIIQLLIIFLATILCMALNRTNLFQVESNINIEKDKILWIYMFFIFIMFIIIICYFQNIKVDIEGYLIIFVCLVLSCIFISCAVFFILNKLYIEKIEKNNIQMYNNIIEEQLEYMRNFKHDYKNILISLSGFIENKDMDGLKKYFYDNLDATYLNNESAYGLINIKSIPVKGLFSIKISKALSLGINIVLNVLSPVEDFHMKDVDACKILGILMDNAIEASYESDEKILNIGILNDEEEIYIIISNSYKIKPLVHKVFEKGYSTKGEDRGLGLDIIKLKKDKYTNIDINTFIKDDLFHQELFIQKK